MSIKTDQLALETTWSTRLTDDIILESIQGKIPPEMESNILGAINILKVEYDQPTVSVYSIGKESLNGRVTASYVVGF